MKRGVAALKTKLKGEGKKANGERRNKFFWEKFMKSRPWRDGASLKN